MLRALVDTETARAEDEGGSCGDTLLAACFMLYELGHREDVFRIHRAKYANMDCGCMIDRQMLTMRSDAVSMRAFLDDAFARAPQLLAEHSKLAGRIADVFANPDFDSEQAYRAQMKRYLGI